MEELNSLQKDAAVAGDEEGVRGVTSKSLFERPSGYPPSLLLCTSLELRGEILYFNESTYFLIMLLCGLIYNRIGDNLIASGLTWHVGAVIIIDLI